MKTTLSTLGEIDERLKASAEPRPVPEGKILPNEAGEYVCPECAAEGKDTKFPRAQSLGMHRRSVHGVQGSASSSLRARAARQQPRTATRQRQEPRAGLDQDRLLRDLFPNGMPAKTETLRAVSGWLDEAERISKMT